MAKFLSYVLLCIKKGKMIMYNEIVKSFKKSGILNTMKSPLMSGESTFCENTDIPQNKSKGFVVIDELSEDDKAEILNKYGKMF